VNAEPGDEFSTRLAKIEAMRARGEEPYPARFDRTHTLRDVRAHWDDKVDEGVSTDDVVRVAGRVLLLRRLRSLRRRGRSRRLDRCARNGHEDQTR
jgi:lysyl-tRNA synthetase class II